MSMNERENANADSSARQSGGGDRPLSMKERLLAERRAKAEAAGDAPAAPAAPQVPATKPAAKPVAARPAAAPAAKPAAAAAPKPASAKPASAPAAKPAADEADDGATARPARSPRPSAATKPAAARKKGEPSDMADNPDVKREINLLRQRESKVMTIAWIATAVVVLAAGIVWFVVHSKTTREENERQAKIQLFKDFAAKADSFNVDTEDGALGLKTFIEASTLDGKPVDWRNNSQISAKISNLAAKASGTLQREVDKKDFFDRLTSNESVAQNASSKTPDDIKLARRNLDALAEKAETYGDETKKRVLAAQLLVDRVYMTRLHDEAKAIAAKGPASGIEALTAYAKAEDECLKMYEKFRQKDKEIEEFAQARLKSIYDESDALCAQVFTPEYINQQQWTDLLNGEWKSKWQHYEDKGFRIDNGMLHAVGPDKSATKDALLAVPDVGSFRDFVLEVEFEIVRGNTQFFYRLLKRTDSSVQDDTWRTGNEDNEFRPGQKYTVTISMIGNMLSHDWANGERESKPTAVSWMKTRKGGWGIAVPADSEIKLHKARMKLLRSGST